VATGVIIGLSGDGAEDAELFSLLDDLTDEAELADAVTYSPGDTRPGTLGGDLGTLLVTLGSSGGIVAAVARVLTTWLRSRNRSLTVEVTTPDGRSVKFEASGLSADYDERVIRQFLSSPESDSPS
jgi:hypothetical protein